MYCNITVTVIISTEIVNSNIVFLVLQYSKYNTIIMGFKFERVKIKSNFTCRQYYDIIVIL